MGIQWGSMWAHTDPVTFRVHTHMHRKAWVSLASEPIWIQWGPMGIQWGSM